MAKRVADGLGLDSFQWYHLNPFEADEAGNMECFTANRFHLDSVRQTISRLRGHREPEPAATPPPHGFQAEKGWDRRISICMGFRFQDFRR